MQWGWNKLKQRHHMQSEHIWSNLGCIPYRSLRTRHTHFLQVYLLSTLSTNKLCGARERTLQGHGVGREKMKSRHTWIIPLSIYHLRLFFHCLQNFTMQSSYALMFVLVSLIIHLIFRNANSFRTRRTFCFADSFIPRLNT